MTSGALDMVKMVMAAKTKKQNPDLTLSLIAFGLSGLLLVMLALAWFKGPAEETTKQAPQTAGSPQGAGSPAHGGPGDYVDGAGPWRVSSENFSLEDKARSRSLPVKVYYPELDSDVAGTQHAAPFPVVIFSHGAGGSREVAPELLSFWASHGYVVFTATHQDSLGLARERGEMTSMKDILRSFGTDPRFRISRVEDARLIIDSLDKLPTQLPELAGLLDSTRIGMSGHSAGAMTTVLMGGAIMDMPVNGPGGPEIEGLKEPRVAATLLLSGQGISRGPGDRQMGAIKEDTWQDCSGPMMVMTGSLDDSAETGQTSKSRQDPYIYAPPGDKYLLYIDGAAHMSFTGKAAGREGKIAGKLQNKLLGRQELQEQTEQYDQERIFSIIQSNSLAFWDAYLKSDPGALAFLQSKAPAAPAGVSLDYQFK
ncbi:hypothetical protein IT575_00400 [bacterium]|nr:hypothetical protein [bacterium]